MSTGSQLSVVIIAFIILIPYLFPESPDLLHCWARYATELPIFPFRPRCSSVESYEQDGRNLV